jgi:glycosyltransferase involved in cell wall biosynthesis
MKKNKILRKIHNLNMQQQIKIRNWSKNLSKDFKTSKIFILPSLYEGCPNILIDAISNQIPCISSNCSGALDVLKNNKAGFIYPINDKQELMENILKILKDYDHFREEAIIFSKTQNRFLIKDQSEKYLKFLFS